MCQGERVQQDRFYSAFKNSIKTGAPPLTATHTNTPHPARSHDRPSRLKTQPATTFFFPGLKIGPLTRSYCNLVKKEEKKGKKKKSTDSASFGPGPCLFSDGTYMHPSSYLCRLQSLYLAHPRLPFLRLSLSRVCLSLAASRFRPNHPDILHI